MDAYFLVWALIIIGGTLIFYAIAKSVLKAAATFFFILLLFLIITGTLTYSDWETVKEEWAQGIKLIIVKEQEDLLFATTVDADEQHEQPAETEAALEELLKQEELKSLEEKYDKIIVIDKKAYDGVDVDEKAELFATMGNSALSFEERAAAFDELNTAMEEQGRMYMLSQYKEGNIEVIPKTMVFRIVSLVPASIIEKFVDEE